MLQWKRLDSKSQLESIIEDSNVEPQIIFKHSTSCSISGMAKRRLEQNWSTQTSAYFLDLLAYREISNDIASRLQVDHESPQIIVIRNGKSIYNESHLDISAESVEKRLKAG